MRVVINRNKKADGTADIVTYNDYFPYGSIARSGGTCYRYDYQGAYAEKDPVTGWNNFELRMYDGRIGRWLSVQPERQYASPYESMSNNPVMGFDPTGGSGTDWYQNITTGNISWIDGSGAIDGYKDLGADYTFFGGNLNEVDISAPKYSFWQIHNMKYDNGTLDDWSGQPKYIQLQEANYEKMYKEYSETVTPAIEGIMLNLNINTRVINFTLSGGAVRDNKATKFFYGGAVLGGISDTKGAVSSLSFDYFAGYKTNSNLTLNNDFSGLSRNFDATLGIINFGFSQPVDQNKNPTQGYNIFYYGAGVGLNVNLGSNGRSQLVN